MVSEWEAPGGLEVIQVVRPPLLELTAEPPQQLCTNYHPRAGEGISMARERTDTEMAKVAPYYSTTTEDRQPYVYHNDSACPDGKRIKPENLRSGTDNRRLCLECPKV